MQSNDKFEDLYSQEDAFPGSEYGRWPVSDEVGDNDDHSSTADLMAELQAAAESGKLATFGRFDGVLSSSSNISAGGARRSSAGAEGSTHSHQNPGEGRSNANRVVDFLDAKDRAGPPSHRLLQIAEYPTSGTGHDEAMGYRPPHPAAGCKSKRQSTPPSQPAAKGIVRGMKDPGGAENAYFERNRQSPGRRQSSNDQARGATPNQQTTKSGSRRRSPTPPIVFNNPSARQSADNPCRSELTVLRRTSHRPPIPDSRAGRPRPANTETTSTISSAHQSTRSSESRRSGLATDMTSEQDQLETASAVDLVTATNNLTVTSPARTRSDADETRYPCPYSLRYPGRGDKQRCAGESADGFKGMGHVKDHIDRAHMKIPLICNVSGCPKRGQDLWRACREGKSVAERARLQNGCPHMNLDERDYIWKADWKDICKRAKNLKKTVRWKFFYQELFPGEPIPDPLNPQGPTTPDFQQQESSALDAISRRALADHDEEVGKGVKSELGSVTDDVQLQLKFLSLMQRIQKQARGD